MDDDPAIINAQLNIIAKDMFEFTDKNTDWGTQGTLIISRSGCKFVGDKLIHTDNCSCTDEDDENQQDERNWR